MLWRLFISLLLILPCFISPFINIYSQSRINYICIQIPHTNSDSEANILQNSENSLYKFTQPIVNTWPVNKFLGLSGILRPSNETTTVRSDSIALSSYFTQCLLLSGSLFSLYFYDPRTANEEFNYLFTSTIFTLGYFPLSYPINTALSYIRSITDIQVSQLYIFGVLGTLTGLTIPLLFHPGTPIRKQIYSRKSITGIFSGYMIGTSVAFAIQNKCNLTYNQSALICSYSLTGITIGAVLSQTIKNTTDQNALLLTLIGGWGGLIVGYLAEKSFPSTQDHRLSIDFSLPAITTIPVIITSKHFPKLKNWSFPLAEFRIFF